MFYTKKKKDYTHLSIALKIVEQFELNTQLKKDKLNGDSIRDDKKLIQAFVSDRRGAQKTRYLNARD